MTLKRQMVLLFVSLDCALFRVHSTSYLQGQWPRGLIRLSSAAVQAPASHFAALPPYPPVK